MAFISNATNFTLGDGVYNNVHGSIIAHNHFHGLKRGREEIEDEAGASPLFIERAHKHRRLEGGAVEREPEAVKLAGVGFEIIDQEDLGLIHQIGHGPGYLLHAGRNKTKNRAITVKVFNSGPIARRKLELEVTLLKGLLHPNIPRLEGMSSSTSSSQFIAYKEFGWKQAKGPLATALQSRVRSIDLGFKMVADISAGLNYLSMQQLSMPAMKVEHFDVFLDIDDRFLILINPTSSDESDVPVSQAPQEDSSWALFNGLCHKLLVSANRILHNEGINRSPALLPPTLTLASSTSGSPSLSSQTVSSQDQQEDADFAAADPRREYIWRAMDRGDQSLATITDEMTANLDTVLGRLHRLTQTDGKNPHRCAGYVREEITLAPTVVESALVAHDTPTPLEICSVCHEVVGFQEKFRCICAASRPGLHTTIKCKVCKVWSHSRCVGNVRSDFTCRLCDLETSGWVPFVSFDYRDPVPYVESNSNLRRSETLEWKSDITPPVQQQSASALYYAQQQALMMQHRMAAQQQLQQQQAQQGASQQQQQPPQQNGRSTPRPGMNTAQANAVAAMAASRGSPLAPNQRLATRSPAGQNPSPRLGLDEDRSSSSEWPPTPVYPYPSLPAIDLSPSFIGYREEIRSSESFSESRFIRLPSSTAQPFRRGGESDFEDVDMEDLTTSRTFFEDHTPSTSNPGESAPSMDFLRVPVPTHSRLGMPRQRRNVAAFQCPLATCGATFTARHNLINHINTHNKYRPHRCPCGLPFTTMGVLNRHKKRCQGNHSPGSSNNAPPSAASAPDHQ